MPPPDSRFDHAAPRPGGDRSARSGAVASGPGPGRAAWRAPGEGSAHREGDASGTLADGARRASVTSSPAPAWKYPRRISVAGYGILPRRARLTGRTLGVAGYVSGRAMATTLRAAFTAVAIFIGSQSVTFAGSPEMGAPNAAPDAPAPAFQQVPVFTVSVDFEAGDADLSNTPRDGDDDHANE